MFLFLAACQYLFLCFSYRLVFLLFYYVFVFLLLFVLLTFLYLLRTGTCFLGGVDAPRAYVFCFPLIVFLPPRFSSHSYCLPQLSCNVVVPGSP